MWSGKYNVLKSGGKIPKQDKRKSDRKWRINSAFGQNFGRSEVTRTPGILLPKQARYQLRYTPIVIKLWSCKWSNLWSNTFLTAIFCFPNRPKFTRLKGFLRFSLLCGVNTVYAPKPPALPTALHPAMKLKFCCDCGQSCGHC